MLTTVSTMQQAMRGLHSNPQRSLAEEGGWASHARHCSCTRCKTKRVVRQRMMGGGLAPIRAPKDPRRSRRAAEDPRVLQLLSAARPMEEVVFARELLSGYLSQAVDALTGAAPPSSSFQGTGVRGATATQALPALRFSSSQLPEAQRSTKRRPAARMAACPLLDAGAAGDSHPGFADATDYTQEKFGETAVSLWREKEREAGSYEARSAAERRRESTSAERYQLPAIANAYASTVSFAADTAEHQREAKLVVREEQRQKARREALQTARVADDATASPGSPRESDYMLAGCVCTAYGQQRQQSGTAVAVTVAAGAPPASGGADGVEQAVAQAADGSQVGAGEANTEWIRPPPSKFDQKPLPSVGSWRQTWLYRHTAMDRISAGLHSLERGVDEQVRMLVSTQAIRPLFCG